MDMMATLNKYQHKIRDLTNIYLAQGKSWWKYSTEKRQRPILFKRVQNDQWTQWNRTIDQHDMHGVMLENIRSERLTWTLHLIGTSDHATSATEVIPINRIFILLSWAVRLCLIVLLHKAAPSLKSNIVFSFIAFHVSLDLKFPVD